MNKNNKILIAGAHGMVGSAIIRHLKKNDFHELITPTHQQLNYIDSNQVLAFFQKYEPEIVVLAAAKVGGIMANISNPAGFIYDNIMIQSNIVHASYKTGVKTIIYIGSSCIYPRECPQPMKEEYMLSGNLEPTNEYYAIAKIAGLKLCEAYHKQYGIRVLNLIPCNLYGLNDSFDPQHSHVLSALVKKFYDATIAHTENVEVWGSGSARREFMNVDDLADAVLFLYQNYHSSEIINVGWGIDYSIKELANLIANVVGYKGSISWDKTKPDGMPRKCMDVSRISALGFSPQISIEQGIKEMVEYYKIHLKNIK